MEFEIFTIVSVLSIPISIIAAFNLNSKLTQNGSVQPFKWGFFNAGMASGAAVGFTLEFLYYAMDSYAEAADYLLAAVIIGVYGFAALFLFQRKKAGAIIATILMLNPVSWLINFVYYKKRWEELGPTSTVPIGIKTIPTARVTSPSFNTQQVQADLRQTTIEFSRTIFSPPETHLGHWSNEHYTVVLLHGNVEILEHGSGSMRFPAIVEQRNEANAYIISYKDPYTLASITFRFVLESVSSLLFTLDRDGYNVEVRESLKRVGD